MDESSPIKKWSVNQNLKLKNGKIPAESQNMASIIYSDHS